MIIEQNEWVFFAARAAILALALLAFTFALLSWRRAGRRDMRQIFLELGESRNETRALAGLAQHLISQMTSLEGRLDDRQQLAAVNVSNTQRGYDLALQMARNGAAPEDMVSASGVTRHEAQLLARLHNPQSG
jgi:Protein of unknown function (DUF2802)